jgi:hypothetical protein
MDAVTAVKIQIVYENDLNVLVPLTPMAKPIKKTISTGPKFAPFPVKNKTRAVNKLKADTPKAIE